MRLELPRLHRRTGASIIYVTHDYKEAMALGDRIAVLESGKILQLGTPADIYMRPANIDIARLFGDPAMNFLKARLLTGPGSAEVELFGTRFPVHDLPQDISERECTIGVRPEMLRLSTTPTAWSIPVEVETELSYNEVAVTLVQCSSGEEVLISRPFGTEGLTSGSAFLEIDAQDILVFDAQSGELLSTQADAAPSAGDKI